MFIQFSGKCGQKHEIIDKNFESTYEHLIVGFNIFLRVWLILVEIGNNKVSFFFIFYFEVILVG